MKITGCIITKDEEINIKNCISSLKPIVSEIIVVDTGSKDQTVLLAKELGATIYHFEWVKDFSKAKNYAISKATGEWIIFVDADEYLESTSTKNVIQCIATAIKANADGLLITLINYDTEKNEVQSSIPKVQIFKKDKNIKYVGAIHEKLCHDSRMLQLLDCQNDISIIHTGYSRGEVQRKQKGNRNLSMLLDELSKNNENTEIKFYLSETYDLMQETELALFYALQAHTTEETSILGMKEKNYLNIISYMRKLKLSNDLIIKVFKEANRHFPSYPDFYVYLGDYHRSLQQDEDAILRYEKAISLLENRDRIMGESQVTAVVLHIYKELARLYYNTDNIQKAAHTFTLILKTDPYDFKTVYQLIKILLNNGENTINIISFVEKIYNVSNSKDLLFLYKASIANGSFELGKYYYDKLSALSIKLEDEVELDFLNGNYEKSSIDFLKSYKSTRDNKLVAKILISIILSKDNRLREDHINELEPYIPRINIRNIISYNQNQNYNHEEFEILTEIINELIRISKYEVIDNMTRRYNDKFLLIVSDILYLNKKFNLALNYLDEYLQRNQEIDDLQLTDILYKMSNCLYQIGELELAEKYIENTYDINKKYYNIFSLWLKILLGLNKINQLLIIKNEASIIFPESIYFNNDDSAINKIEIDNCIKELLSSESFLLRMKSKEWELRNSGRVQEANVIRSLIL